MSGRQQLPAGEPRNGVPDGRRLHKSASAVFGAPEIKCVGEIALAIFGAISLMVNMPRL